MDCAIDVANITGLISCTVAAQLICGFVFAYDKSQFSHDAANTLVIGRRCVSSR